MKKVLPVYLLLFFSIAGSLHADSSQVVSDSVLFISGDMLGYLNNLEYYNGYREGEPFWGAYVNVRMVYRPLKKFTFSGGIHIRKDFGDESFLSNIIPLFQAQYIHKNFRLIFGELFNKNRHGLLDALLKEQYRYKPVIEEGIQIFLQNNYITQDCWVNYPALNTKDHREQLCAGNCTFVSLKPITLSFMGYISHFGGQLFAPKNDPVRENVTGAVGITYKLIFKKKFEEIGVEQFIISSYTSDTTSDGGGGYDGGWGSLSHIWITFVGVKFGVSFYKGNDFTTWEGNPMYKSNEPYYFFDVSKSFTFAKNIFIDLGLRFDFMKNCPSDYFQDNQILFHIGTSFNKKIK